MALIALSGCGIWRPVVVPMATVSDLSRCATRPDTLIVMLPGSFARPEEFVREGFVSAIRERQIAADIVLVDAHLGYYADRSIIDRLRADIVAPARARGYTHIWLAGISVGAFGAMIYTEAQPDGIDGIVALGPYLGDRHTTNQIKAAGGLRAWKAPSGALDREEIDLALWRWLQGYALPAGPPRPVLMLGYGRDDRFVVSADLLATALPTDHVFTTDGGHDWKPWLVLWQRMLDVTPLPRNDHCQLATAP